MRTTTTVAALMTSLLFVAPLAASAQTSDDKACERAWLASDWPTVVVECSDAASNSEQDRFVQQRTENDQDLPSELRPPAFEFDADDSIVAGMLWARTAVGYAKLKKDSLYVSTRQKALDDLDVGIKMGYAPAALQQKAASVRELVASPLFLIDAPDSDALAHI